MLIEFVDDGEIFVFDVVDVKEEMLEEEVDKFIEEEN